MLHKTKNCDPTMKKTKDRATPEYTLLNKEAPRQGYTTPDKSTQEHCRKGTTTETAGQCQLFLAQG